MFNDLNLEYPVSLQDFNRNRIGGSIMLHDAEVLYALIKALEPVDILELGQFVGISTNVLIRAVRDNGRGRIVSLDKYAPGQAFNFGSTSDTTIGWVGRQRAEMLEPDALNTVTLETGDVIEFLKGCPDGSYDFIFEDTDHRQVTVNAAIKQFRRILRPGGVVTLHNTDHIGVIKGLQQAGVYNKLYRFKKRNNSSIGVLRWEDLHD